MNSRFKNLQPYPFAKLRALLSEIEPTNDKRPIKLSIGEPFHQPPKFALQALTENSDHIRKYPPTKGSEELRTAISNWATKRFNLPEGALDSESMVLPCNGTREALFAIVQTVIDTSDDQNPLVIMPNPCYQIYEGAALLAGADTKFVNNIATSQQPDFDSVTEEEWTRCQLLFLCTPGNPSGVNIPKESFKKIIHLADKYDFIVVSDECYSELYLDEKKPALGILQVCAEIERLDCKRCLAFHSLSKRSNLAGLRSGFVAGDSAIIEKFLLYRTYHGSAMSLQNQAASAKAWNDEAHVIENRRLYREKYAAILPLLAEKMDYIAPDAGFYLWLKTPVCDVEFTKKLYKNENVTVLPGSFLSRETNAGNPGTKYIRLALVDSKESCVEGVQRILKQVDRIEQS